MPITCTNFQTNYKAILHKHNNTIKTRVYMLG